MTWWTTNHVSSIEFPFTQWQPYKCGGTNEVIDLGFTRLLTVTLILINMIVKYGLDHNLGGVINDCSLFRDYSMRWLYQGNYLGISLGHIFINDSNIIIHSIFIKFMFISIYKDKFKLNYYIWNSKKSLPFGDPGSLFLNHSHGV